MNTFVKDANDPNPLIRALAVRTMGCIRVEKITEYLCEPLRKALRDEARRDTCFTSDRVTYFCTCTWNLSRGTGYLFSCCLLFVVVVAVAMSLFFCLCMCLCLRVSLAWLQACLTSPLHLLRSRIRRKTAAHTFPLTRWPVNRPPVSPDSFFFVGLRLHLPLLFHSLACPRACARVVRMCAQDPYVRKTAAVCVAKLYDINADLVEDQGFLQILRDLICDPNPTVRSERTSAPVYLPVRSSVRSSLFFLFSPAMRGWMARPSSLRVFALRYPATCR